MIIDVLCLSYDYETRTQHVNNHRRGDGADNGGEDVVEEGQSSNSPDNRLMTT